MDIQIYDVITKKNIILENRKLIKQSQLLGFDYSSLQRLFRGSLTHLMSRYILPYNLNQIITLVNTENDEEYDCVNCFSLFYYLGVKPSQNDVKYFYALIKGRQRTASICGIAVYLKGQQKTSRFVNRKSQGPRYLQAKKEQQLRRKINSRVRCRLRSALKNNKKNTTHDLLGCSTDFLLGYLEKQFVEGMTWANYGEWHIDHVKPLSLFDLRDVQQQKIACHYSNLQPLWARDNLSKGNKLLSDSPVFLLPNNVGHHVG